MADPVIIVPYDVEWPRLFSSLGQALRAALGETALRIDHIGSTAVPDLDAKPVIDVQVSVADLEMLDEYRPSIEGLGFVWRADNPDRTQRYFRERPGERRTHIHVRRFGSWAEQAALLFRDYMRAHPVDAGRYAELKRCLARQHHDDRQGYTEAKSAFIWAIMAQADRWSQETGWQPPPTDA